MSEHPVRLSVEDDLSRTRVTVFFRWLLVIPHLLWLGLWGIAVLFAAIANWVATLAAGRSPEGLHNFLASYVRYATQVYAYLYLVANPYPQFEGRSGYPVDVSIAAPLPQSRWSVGFRLIIAVPALLFATVLVGDSAWGSTSGFNFYGIGLLHAVAFLGWFASLARARMPRGLRDAAAYAISYAAQFWAYVFLLTDRYPSSDPLVAIGELPLRSDPVRLEVDDELRRSRLSTFFRLLLAIPHLIWLELWGILALLAGIANWFALLFTARSPAVLHRFLRGYLRYLVHVYAYLHLLADPYPGFLGRVASYPVEAVIDEAGERSRLTAAFRVVLAIPAYLLAAAYGGVLITAAFLGWFAVLATGEMPRGLRNAGALALRYLAQTQAYGYFLLTDAYPYGGPCVEQTPGSATAQTIEPLST